jgi:hypothetical protein
VYALLLHSSQQESWFLHPFQVDVHYEELYQDLSQMSSIEELRPVSENGISCFIKV